MRKRKLKLINGMDFELDPPPNYRLLPNTNIIFSYPLLMTDTVMKFCFPSLQEVMRKICTPDVVLSFHYEDNKPNPLQKQKHEFKGTLVIT